MLETSEERLELLRSLDHQRSWFSVDDKRTCVICQRVISGRDILIRERFDGHSLHCPTLGCPSNYSHWSIFQPRPVEVSAGGEASFFLEPEV